MTLLELSTNDQVATVLLWTVGVLLGLFITLFIAKWIFQVSKRVRQNDQIISLLKKLADK